MDKKSLTGFILIALIFLAWSIYNSKEKEKEAAAEKHYTDSVFTADSLHSLTEQKQKKHAQDSIAALSRNAAPVNKDSLVKAKETAVFGCFSKSVSGDNKPVVIENEKLKAWIYPRGGIIGQVELKGQKTSDGKPLILFRDDSTHFGLGFFDQQRRRLRTDSLYFNVYGSGFSVKGAEHNSVTLRLYTDDDKGYIEYCYTLKGNSNLVGCTVSFRNMNTVFPDDMHTVDLNWVMKAPSQEMSIKNQRAISTVFYNFDGEDGVESLSETKDEKKDFTGEPKWVSFKQQYFSSILIADRKFANSGTVEVKTPSDPFIVKNLGAVIGIPFGHTARETFPIKMYFGPNKFSELSSYHLHLEREINLGSSFFGSINRYIFVPLFSFLGGIFPNNYGLVILLLTVIVKIVLFPIAYKSFISAAKMRVLKPEIDEINEKYKGGDQLKKQQATMELYKKAGANPASGCVPLLLQIPILFSLIRLFPASFEIRQQGLWWAKDLSTYDSAWNFSHSIWLLGDHVSLFALLMTASTILYTWMNQQMLTPGSTQMPGMKWLVYLMPVVFFFALNSYSAALSYYYFVSNIITFGQMFLMRRFVDEKAIHAKIQENKKKQVTKKPGLMQRLEQAQRKRMEELQQQQKGQKGRKK